MIGSAARTIDLSIARPLAPSNELPALSSSSTRTRVLRVELTDRGIRRGAQALIRVLRSHAEKSPAHSRSSSLECGYCPFVAQAMQRFDGGESISAGAAVCQIVQAGFQYQLRIGQWRREHQWCWRHWTAGAEGVTGGHKRDGSDGGAGTENCNPTPVAKSRPRPRSLHR